jgi:hypothetical protein
VRVCDACFEKLAREAGFSSVRGAPRASLPDASREERGELSISDFEIIKHLGRGAFGQVLEVCACTGSHSQRRNAREPQVMEKSSRKMYALKARFNAYLSVIRCTVNGPFRSWRRRKCSSNRTPRSMFSMRYWRSRL